MHLRFKAGKPAVPLPLMVTSRNDTDGIRVNLPIQPDSAAEFTIIGAK